jgi:amylosucrase
MIGSNQNRTATNGAVKASDPLRFEAVLSLQRLRPRLQNLWDAEYVAAPLRAEFEQRLDEHWAPLFSLLYDLYGSRYDFFFHLEQILLTAARAWINRPDELRELDRHRINDPDWFASQESVGGALYVDLFSENLGRLRESVGYFKDLGLTYLHLMPLFAVRPGDNDGGYAIRN